jgi:DNA integrity scanning protein DisA with diadenylate cyclase activity
MWQLEKLNWSKKMTNLYKLIMDSRHNPLRNIPDMNTRHMIMQVLAWMWCIIFSMYLGSIVAFGISAVIHALLIAGVFITAGVFETAKRRPQYFGGLGRGAGGEHE